MKRLIQISEDFGGLAAGLAEIMVHGGGIADWHDQRRRFASNGQTAPNT
jgi:hypothetical protein